jgi:hypothetical protein
MTLTEKSKTQGLTLTANDGKQLQKLCKAIFACLVLITSLIKDDSRFVKLHFYFALRCETKTVK